jgi:hypothetical protein
MLWVACCQLLAGKLLPVLPSTCMSCLEVPLSGSHCSRVCTNCMYHLATLDTPNAAKCWRTSYTSLQGVTCIAPHGALSRCS